jgi:tRNA (guanine37-N1)-methyltransferase
MQVDIITLFPKMLEGFLAESILGNAISEGKVAVELHNLRDWAQHKHNVVDDYPFGGGAGMLLKPEPLFRAIREVKAKSDKAHVIYLSPDGEQLSSVLARELATYEHLVLVSGHYEGIDQRVRDYAVDREVSIGDYILTNGTLPAAVVLDAVSRFIPGVLGEEKSLTQDAFNDNLLSFPQYTRPAEFEGMAVPEVLLSGNHEAIQRWRREKQLEKTQQLRPDLLSQQDNKK